MNYIGMMNYPNLKADIMTVFLMKNSYHLMIIWKLIIQKQEKMSYLIMK